MTRDRSVAATSSRARHRGRRYFLRGVGWLMLILVGWLLHPARDLPEPVMPEGSLGGPTRVVAGVPVGYAQSPDGALSAAMNYSAAYGRASLADPATRVAMADAFISRPARSSTVGVLDASAQLMVEAVGGGGFSTTVPVRGEVVGFAPSAATVRLWTVGFSFGPKLKVLTESQGYTVISLGWEDGDWKYLGSTSGDFTPSAVPDPNATPSTDEQMRELVGGSKDFFGVPLPR